MKAYIVRNEESYEDYCTVVFAETRGKAIQEALHTDACEDARFTDIRAIRAPELDSYYRGSSEMDWSDDKDRLAMVKHLGFHCSYEISTEDCECESCPAKEFCDRYEAENEERSNA